MRMTLIRKPTGGGAVGTAKAPDVLAGKTFSSDEGTGLVGTMPNQGKKDFTPGKTPQTIPAGYHNGQGEIDSLGGDAEKGDVLIGKTFSSDIEGRAVTGTMPNQGAKIITPTKTGVIIPAGYHNGQGEVVGDPNFEAGNIKEGVEIWGVVGTMTPYSPPVGNALPAHVLAGKTFESAAAGAGAIGTMVDRGAVIITPGTSNKAIPAGYHSGSGYVVGDSNLTASNIKAGINIFGVEGSLWGVALEPSSTNIVHSFENNIGLIGDGIYHKIKEVQINRGFGRIYVAAAQFSPNGGENYIQVTRNGTVVMSDNSTGSANIRVYVSGQVDISLGDRIAVHCRTSKEGAYLDYFRIGYNVVPQGGPDNVLL